MSRFDDTSQQQLGRRRPDLLAKIEIIKGEVKNGQLHEQVITVAEYKQGQSEACVTWQDPSFDATTPAYWYARVLATETPRWSKRLCESADLCDKFPEADQMIAKRAWSPSIWQSPND